MAELKNNRLFVSSESDASLLTRFRLISEYANYEVSVIRLENADNIEQISPVFEKLPVLLQTGGSSDFSVFGSHAIAQYIASTRNKSTNLLGCDAKERARIMQWLFFQDNEIECCRPFLLYSLRGWNAENKEDFNAAKRQLDKALILLDTHLLDNTYLASNNITLADITVLCSLEEFMHITYKDRHPFKNLARWMSTIQNQPSYRKVERDCYLDSFFAQFPVALATSKTKGRHLKSTHKLEPGTTVIYEQAAGNVLLKDSIDEVCANCLAYLSDCKEASIVCPDCRKQTYYCSKTCQDEHRRIHFIECICIVNLPGIAGFSKTDYSLLRLIVNVIIRRYLEKSTQASLLDEKVSENHAVSTSFSCFQDLMSHKESQRQEWKDSIVTAAKDLVQELPSYLDTSVDEVLTFASQINSNSHAITISDGKRSGTRVGIGMFPLVSMVNHSCKPNCTFVGDSRGRLLVKTIAPVEQGEELCVPYIDLWIPKSERQIQLLATKHFICKCSRCQFDEKEPYENARLDGIKCTNCDEGVYSSSAPHVCFNCKSEVQSCEWESIQSKVQEAWDNAYELFASNHTDFGRHSFEIFLKEYGKILDRSHHLIFNSFTPLMNLCMRQSDFKFAKEYCSMVLNAMESNTIFIPQFWPEKADFYFRLHEIYEVLSTVDGNGGLDKAYIRKSFDALEACYKIKAVVYGFQHPHTLYIDEEMKRLDCLLQS